VTLRIFFVTDLHGSDVCFRKVLGSIRSLKNPNVLVVGGDITGKIVVPVVRHGARWRAEWDGTDRNFATQMELNAFEEFLVDAGAYPWVCSSEEAGALNKADGSLDEVIKGLKIARLMRWVELADAKLQGSGVQLYVNAGNDDQFYIDNLLDQSRTIIRPEGKIEQLGEKVVMISTGYTNQTPWNCPRDTSEEALALRIEAMTSQVPDMRRCIFNFHCPPHGTSLDQAPALDCRLVPRIGVTGVQTTAVGSTAVRNAIERCQPVIGLHGHIHEVHAMATIGRSLCFNPGSEYYKGRLRGVYLVFRDGELQTHMLTREA
jgi:Icc-related predicted phosphoesterase